MWIFAPNRTAGRGDPCSSDELLRAASEAGRRVRHFAHLIPDNGVIDHDGYNRILARIRSEIADGRIVYTHCWGGKCRTSTVIGCLLIDDGLNYESAVSRIAELRAGTRKATARGLEGVGHRFPVRRRRGDPEVLPHQEGRGRADCHEKRAKLVPLQPHEGHRSYRWRAGSSEPRTGGAESVVDLIEPVLTSSGVSN